MRQPRPDSLDRLHSGLPQWALRRPRVAGGKLPIQLIQCGRRQIRCSPQPALLVIVEGLITGVLDHGITLRILKIGGYHFPNELTE